MQTLNPFTSGNGHANPRPQSPTPVITSLNITCTISTPTNKNNPKDNSSSGKQIFTSCQLYKPSSTFEICLPWADLGLFFANLIRFRLPALLPNCIEIIESPVVLYWAVFGLEAGQMPALIIRFDFCNEYCATFELSVLQDKCGNHSLDLLSVLSPPISIQGS